VRILITYEKSLKRTKAVIKVPTQFVGTAYKKSLKITKEVFNIRTQFVVVTVYEKSSNLDYRFDYL
jgi:hypothetical protein